MTEDEKTALLAERLMGWILSYGSDAVANEMGCEGDPWWAKDGEDIWPVYDSDMIMPAWQPFQRIDHAWMVAEAMGAAEFGYQHSADNGEHEVMFYRPRASLYEDANIGRAIENNGPYAICEAAGRALSLWGEE